MNVNKILIIGISGTGKTRLAKMLSDILNIPVIHYDELAWGKDWEEVKTEEVDKKTKEILKKDKWIIEGYINPTAKEKLDNADMVIYLDFKGPSAFWGGLQRWWQYRGKVRPEMKEGCTEEFNFDYLKTMLKRKERVEIEKEIKGFEDKTTRLKSRKEVDKFIKSF